MLFEHQRALDQADLRGYAAALGLDVGQFERALANRIYAGRVREDFQSGVRSDVNGTPTFFINGLRHDGSYDLQTLLATLERASARPANIVGA